MNDFTKDELEDLKAYAEVYIAQSPLLERRNGPLRDKIQSRIDNYCYHLNSNISFNCEDCEMIL